MDCNFQPSLGRVLFSSIRTRSFARRRVKEHRQTYDEQNIRDFVDLYIQAGQADSNDRAYTGERYRFVATDMIV